MIRVFHLMAVMRCVWDANQRNSYFYDFNKNASEYYKGSENIYFTSRLGCHQQVELYYGARLEWQKLKGENSSEECKG